MTTVIQAEKRTKLKPSALRRLREAGCLPGIAFGKNRTNEMIHISTIEFQKWVKQGASGFIELQLDGKKRTVLLEDLQRDPVTKAYLHVDFQFVQWDEIVRTKIAVKFTGTPAGVKQGGVVQVQSAHIEVEALPNDLPTAVEYDISGLEIGGAVQVKDITFSPTVTVVSGSEEFLVTVVK